jgi:hypothetical protein
MPEPGASSSFDATQTGPARTSSGLLHRVASKLVRGDKPPALILRSRQLRIGFEMARPWCFFVNDELRGEEVEACKELARLLGASPMFIHLQREELLAQLRRGELDLVIGGLVEQGYEGIRCVQVRKLERVESFSHYRKIFFPTVWWTRRECALWRWLLRLFLSLRRLAAERRSNAW